MEQMQAEPVQKDNVLHLGLARSFRCVEIVCDGEV